MRRRGTLRKPTQRLAGIVPVVLALLIGCQDGALREQADATCAAVSAERFEEALALSETGSGSTGAGREIAECRCIALLSLGDRAACTDLLGPLLGDTAAADWVPHSVLTKLMLRTWQADGQVAEGARLARRAAPIHRNDLDLLQLEIMLRSSIEDEEAVLASIEDRLDEDIAWIPQRLVLALAWNRRSGYTRAIEVLGTTPPPIEHPLALPWYESRIQAQAASGDLAAVQATFDIWRRTGWDPIDLDARYALRLSVDQLIDPDHDTIDLLREAISTEAELRDRNIVWGLHRRLITELLAVGRPDLALEAYDTAIQTVALEGITRAEIERALRLASGEIDRDAFTTLRFRAGPALAGGTLWLSPSPDAAPDAGYVAHPIVADQAIEVVSQAGLHARRWVARDAAGQVRGSGSIWPEPGASQEVVLQAGAPSQSTPWSAAERRPGDGRRRVFAILADCGDWRLTEYLRARGDLPFHDHLFSEGYRAVLESRPAFTAAAMQSLVWPAPEAQPGTLEWIHHLGLELAGLESVGRNPVGWLAQILPERPNLFDTLGSGSLVAANMLLTHGRIDAGRHAEVVGPAGERRTLPSQNAYRTLTPAELERHPGLAHDADTRKFAETIAAEMDAAEAIARAGQVDFLFLRLEALDLMTHAHFGPLDGRGQDDARGPLLDTYRYIDARLAEVHELLDEDDWLVFLSDHGIRSSMEHEEDAVFVVMGAGVPHGRAEGRPALRGVPRSLAAMLRVETDWPETGTTPWLLAREPDHAEEPSIAARP